jgi:hypothetical protein
MRKLRRWLILSVASGLVALIGIGLRGGQADEKRMTTEDVIKLWEPRLDGVKDYQQFVVAPKESSKLAAATFRVVGPSFEGLWNHYAELCGIKDRYEAKHLRITGGSSARGTYVVSDRGSLDARATRGLSVFMLRTDGYTVTATIQPDPDGKAMLGSIAVVIP